MFCHQCEQTPMGGCTVAGVCGKDETIASLQDIIVFALKGIAEFPGAILATTNCVMPIKGTYADRMFSYDVAGLENVRKIENDDFTPLIEKALELPEANIESDETLLTGFHHETVIGIAPEIIQAVKDGKIQRFFVIAGCDAPGKGGEYYRLFVGVSAF
ncbi:hypothetical protein B4110_1857 [Parageobacillus toebii]|uniref:Hydroxylamine reductase n=1 Tax=Parageobacillus toebii TaxID=153151 RepID=A0A150MEF0_9BACL|nr:hypothetical protein B4110_1857 [Parageobacillus toebii]